jgi:hypothetical protein
MFARCLVSSKRAHTVSVSISLQHLAGFTEMEMTKAELIEAAYELTGGDLKTLSSDKIKRLMTVTQYVTDICLNEIESRGQVDFHEGLPIVPYMSRHSVDTMLTRGY